jgi:ABC-type polysaccharide/polyol phosphate export permease
MWLLSGAMFPLDGKLFSSLALFNPMAYLVAGLRKSLLNLPGSFFVCFTGLFISLIIALLLLFLAVSRRPIE